MVETPMGQTLNFTGTLKGNDLVVSFEENRWWKISRTSPSRGRYNTLVFICPIGKDQETGEFLVAENGAIPVSLDFLMEKGKRATGAALGAPTVH